MLELVDVHTYYGESHILQGISLVVEKAQVQAEYIGVGKRATN